MPRFFLHIEDGTQRIEDTEGSELPDLAAARQEALKAARQLWAAAILDNRDISMRRFLIVDADDGVIDTVAMDEALPAALLGRLRQRSQLL